MRSLATVQKIINIEPIENSDFLEKASILGWGVVVKKGQFQIGDFCVFFEIDSLLPDEPRYEFLKKSSWSVQREKIRLKTVKLRGTLSQGLAMATSDFPEIKFFVEGDDLTNDLNVEKYEPSIPAQLAGDANSFNWPITKTDEERMQNGPAKFIREITGKPYYITTKLDGTSGSFIMNSDGEYHVCSRNYSLRENPDNTYWRISNKYGIKDILTKYLETTGKRFSIQGEVVGPGIQANKLGLKEIDMYVFNVIDTDANKKLSFEEFTTFCNVNGLKRVPLVEVGDSFSYESLDEMLELSKGKYIDEFFGANRDQDREGIVIRTKDQEISFKVINNDFLLKGGD